MSLSTLQNLSLGEYKEFLKNETTTNLLLLKDILDDLYYNDCESTFPDNRYDLLIDLIKKRGITTIKVGSTLREGQNRALLPFWMGSADKITPNEPEVLERWIKKNDCKEFVVTEKLDGVSCLFYKKGKNIKLYTRGDGREGADISYLIKAFNIPEVKGDICVRGELIIKKRDFEKYKKDYKNARNMVTGLIGSKTAREGLSDIHFVSYEIVGDSMDCQSSQLSKLKKLGFEVVNYTKLSLLDIETLSTFFVQYRTESQYTLDGIIVQADKEYDRNTDGNPDYMFAFKMLKEEDIHETRVIDIEWNVSRWRQLKPVVIVEPVETGGITMKRATAHTAKFVEENKLGPNSIIKITRSKDVIPYIVEVVKSTKAKMPDIEYEWDKNHVNILSLEDDDNIEIKSITSFFEKMKVKHVSEATISKMYQHGLNTIFKILETDEKTLLEIPTFKKLTVNRILTNIKSSLQNMKISTVLGASGIFGLGIGEKKVDSLLLALPNIFEEYKKHSKEDLIKKIECVEGFSTITAEKIVDKLEEAKKFLDNMKRFGTFKVEERVSDSLQNKKIVMTGFRDANLEKEIKERGGQCTGSVSKNTSYLIVADKNSTSEKIKKARDLGITIMSKEEFMNYLKNE